jgi:hypothetical protein
MFMACSESYVVIMHFNEEINMKITGAQELTDEFVDKAMQEYRLLNLKAKSKPANSLTEKSFNLP